MSAITYDGIPYETESETEAPAVHSIKTSREYSREREFRAALDSYMADYRMRHAMLIAQSRCSARNTHLPSLMKLANWLRHRVLTHSNGEPSLGFRRPTG